MSTGKYRKEHNCLNCGAHVEKHYCSDCGQPNLELKESFWGFISHSIAHYFHFENKFFSTLKVLLIEPGKVTLDYLAGKRARYINPVSMYIFVSIIYFLVGYSPVHKLIKINERNGKIKTEAVTDTVNKKLDSLGATSKVPAIANEIKQSIKDEVDKETFKSLNFKQQSAVLSSLEKDYKSNKTDSLKKVISRFSSIHNDRNDSTYNAYLNRQMKLSAFEKDNWIERLIKKRSFTIGAKSKVIDEILEHNRPKQYFLLMPLLALFIMWNFRKNHIYYLDHLIFTIHGMTAYFIISIFTQPLIKYVFGDNSLFSSIIKIGVAVWVCWYMYKALKIFYKRQKVVGKMFMIFILYYAAFSLTEIIMINLISYVAT